MLLGLARPLYCIIRWRVTGVNYCAEVRARNLEMALERIGGSDKKVIYILGIKCHWDWHRAGTEATLILCTCGYSGDRANNR